MAAPLCQAASRQPDPPRMLAVFKYRVHSAAQPRRAVDLVPSKRGGDQQPVGRSKHDPPIRIERGNSAQRGCNQWRVRLFEQLLAGRTLQNTHFVAAYPHVSVTVLEDSLPLLLRKAAFLPQNRSAVIVDAADFTAAPVPDGLAVQQHRVGAASRRSRRTRNHALGKFCPARRGGELDEADIRRQISVAVAVGLNALDPINRLEGTGNLFEMVARQTEKTEVPAHQQRAVRRIAEGRIQDRRNALLGPKQLEAVAVEAVQAPFRVHPDEADLVLIHAADGQVAESVRNAEVAEIVFLGVEQAG